MKAALPWLGQGRQITVAVFGDIILDEYLSGKVNRISPEAPVPIHHVTSTTHVAGGAANAARNIQMVGGKAIAFSVIGNDPTGEELRALLDRDGIDTRTVLPLADRPTIRKTRITSGSQQIVRIDWERVHPIGVVEQARLLKAFEETKADVLLLSDYGKGVLTDDLLEKLIVSARRREMPIVVDPKGHDFSKYRGCSIITPNRAEAFRALGREEVDSIEPVAIAAELQLRYKLDNILMTLGSKGMLLYGNASPKGTYLPAEALEVFDVSGAGDTVAAVMALALGAGASLDVGMTLANRAAAIVVQKWGTQPVLLGELEAALASEPGLRRCTSKIVSADAFVTKFGGPAVRAKKVVFTNGCFDILHAGHVTYLEEARRKGDLLVVGLNSDDSIKRIKGPSRPLQDLNSRSIVLSGLECVDYVVIFDDDTPLRLIEKIIPDVLVKGADYSEDNIVGADVVRRHGGEITTIPLLEGYSTSSVIERALRETHV